MKKILAIAGLIFICLAGPVVAQSFDEATAAFNRGDHASALSQFMLLGAHGHVVAQANVSIMYFYGVGVTKDEAQAIDWAHRAAEQGYAVAQAQLGFILLNASNEVRDSTRAARWYRRAAEQGYDVAQATLGTLYYQGVGVPQDFIEAVKWFRLAANQGNADAFAKLGVAYFRGDGVPQDYEQAYQWFSVAANLGRDNMSQILDYLASQLSGTEIANAKRAAQKQLEQISDIVHGKDRSGIEHGSIIGRDLYPDRHR